jgi:hypothetical protein
MHSKKQVVSHMVPYFILIIILSSFLTFHEHLICQILFYMYLLIEPSSIL